MEDLAIGLKMFRDAGGKRAVLANIFTDFRASPGNLPMAHVPKISLFCTPAEARDRLRRLEDLGLDGRGLAGAGASTGRPRPAGGLACAGRPHLAAADEVDLQHHGLSHFRSSRDALYAPNKWVPLRVGAKVEHHGPDEVNRGVDLSRCKGTKRAHPA